MFIGKSFYTVIVHLLFSPFREVAVQTRRILRSTLSKDAAEKHGEVQVRALSHELVDALYAFTSQLEATSFETDQFGRTPELRLSSEVGTAAEAIPHFYSTVPSPAASPASSSPASAPPIAKKAGKVAPVKAAPAVKGKAVAAKAKGKAPVAAKASAAPAAGKSAAVPASAFQVSGSRLKCAVNAVVTPLLKCEDEASALVLLKVLLMLHHPACVMSHLGKGSGYQLLSFSHPWQKLARVIRLSAVDLQDNTHFVACFRASLFTSLCLNANNVALQQAAANVVHTLTALLPEFTVQLLAPEVVAVLQSAIPTLAGLSAREEAIFATAPGTILPSEEDKEAKNKKEAVAGKGGAATGSGRGRGGAASGTKRGGASTSRGSASSSSAGKKKGVVPAAAPAPNAEEAAEKASQDEVRRKVREALQQVVMALGAVEAICTASHHQRYMAAEMDRSLREYLLPVITKYLFTLLSLRVSRPLASASIYPISRYCLDHRAGILSRSVATAIITACVCGEGEQKDVEKARLGLVVPGVKVAAGDLHILARVITHLKAQCVRPIGTGALVPSTFTFCLPIFEAVLTSPFSPTLLCLNVLSVFWSQSESSSRAASISTVPLLLHIIEQHPMLCKSALMVLLASASGVTEEVHLESLAVGLLSSTESVRTSSLLALERSAYFRQLEGGAESASVAQCSIEESKSARDVFLARLRFAMEDAVVENHTRARALMKLLGDTTLDWEVCRRVIEPLLASSSLSVQRMAAKALANAGVECGQSVGALLEVYKSVLDAYYPPKEEPEWKKFMPGQAVSDTPKVDKQQYARYRLGVGLLWQALVPHMEGSLSEDSARLIDMLFSKCALLDEEMDVRAEMLEAGARLVRVHGAACNAVVMPELERISSITENAADSELLREGALILLAEAVVHLNPNDRRIIDVLDKLVEALKTNAQGAVAGLLSTTIKLIRDKPELVGKYVKKLMDRTRDEADPHARYGAAMGVAAIVHGLGVPILKRHNIMNTLQKQVLNKKKLDARTGALYAFTEMSRALGRGFDCYVIHIIPQLLQSFGDTSPEVRRATEETSKELMRELTGAGIKMVLPAILKALDDKNWRTKTGSCELLGAMAYCAPRQLSQCLPQIVPRLQKVLADSHDEVEKAARRALKHIGSVINNTEIMKQVDLLLDALVEPNLKTEPALQQLLKTTFVHVIDPPSLALVVPVLECGLQDRRTATKKSAARIVGNMTRLTSVVDLLPYLDRLLDRVCAVLLDPIPEAREVSAKALGQIVAGVGEARCPKVIPCLLKTLVSDTGTVERCGSAQVCCTSCN